MSTKENKALKKIHLTNFHIAGFGFWEGCKAFSKLKIGAWSLFGRQTMLLIPMLLPFTTMISN